MKVILGILVLGVCMWPNQVDAPNYILPTITETQPVQTIPEPTEVKTHTQPTETVTEEAPVTPDTPPATPEPELVPLTCNQSKTMCIEGVN